MSSLTFSLGSCKPRKLGTSSSRIPVKIFDAVDISGVKCSSLTQKAVSVRCSQQSENSTLVRRRDAIGFGLCFGLLDVILQLQPSAAAESAACEIIVSPSGLGYCDKVVGYGPEAVKGQLIKVMKRFHISFLVAERISGLQFLSFCMPNNISS